MADEQLPFLAQRATETDVLTQEDWDRAVASIREQTGYDPCRVGAHVIHPRALYTPGVYTCGNCGAPVRVEVPLSECHG